MEVKMVNRQILLAIPVINEEENLRILIPEIVNLQMNIDILIIDDASSDGTSAFVSTLQKLHKFPIHYLRRNSRLGIGRAHLDALKFAKQNSYAITITMDGDLTHRPEDIPRMVSALLKDSKSALIIASRFKTNSSLEGWTALRILMTYMGHFLTRFILNLKVDASSGFRVYDLSRIDLSLFDRINMSGYDFFFKSAYILTRNNLVISEIGVSLRSRNSGDSKMYLSNMLTGLIELLTFKIRFWLRHLE